MMFFGLIKTKKDKVSELLFSLKKEINSYGVKLNLLNSCNIEETFYSFEEKDEFPKELKLKLISKSMQEILYTILEHTKELSNGSINSFDYKQNICKLLERNNTNSLNADIKLISILKDYEKYFDIKVDEKDKGLLFFILENNENSFKNRFNKLDFSIDITFLEGIIKLINDLITHMMSYRKFIFNTEYMQHFAREKYELFLRAQELLQRYAKSYELEWFYEGAKKRLNSESLNHIVWKRLLSKIEEQKKKEENERREEQIKNDIIFCICS